MISEFMLNAFGKPEPGRNDTILRHLCETNILPGADTTADHQMCCYHGKSCKITTALRIRKRINVVVYGAQSTRELSSRKP